MKNLKDTLLIENSNTNNIEDCVVVVVNDGNEDVAVLLSNDMDAIDEIDSPEGMKQLSYAMTSCNEFGNKYIVKKIVSDHTYMPVVDCRNYEWQYK